MKQIKLFFAMMFVAFVAVACGGDGSPEDAAKNMMEAFATGDSATVMKTIYIDETGEDAEMKQMISSKIGMMAGMMKEEIEGKGGIKSIDTANIVYNDDESEATLDVTITYGNGEISGPDEMEAVKTKDGWKVKL